MCIYLANSGVRMINWRRKFNINTIRKKMLFYFLLSIILVSSVSVYLSVNSRHFFRKIDSMFRLSILLEDMQNYLTSAEENLVLFIQTKDSDSKNRFQLYMDQLHESTEKIQDSMLADYYYIDRLINLIDTFSVSANEAINAKQGRDADTVRQKYNDVHQTGQYIMEEIQQLNLQQLKRNTEYYSALSKNNAIVEKANLVMIIDILVLSCIIVFYITYKMTDPIMKLSHAAEEISKGILMWKRCMSPLMMKSKQWLWPSIKWKNSVKIILKHYTVSQKLKPG